MSWPWAHVSISRAAAALPAFIGGPYQARRASGSTVAKAANSFARAARHHSRTSLGSNALPRSRASAMYSSESPESRWLTSSAKAAGSSIDWVCRSSKNAR